MKKAFLVMVYVEKDDDDFITSIEIFINFSYDDTSYADIKSYLQEWE